MGIFSRISDIISANFNEMADNFEDPEKMLKQAIREMEESIADATQQTAKAMANEKTLARELQRNRQQAGVWQSRAEAAVAAGDDDLARKALVRRREHEDLAAALEDQSQSANQAAVTLKRQLDAMRAKLAEAKRSLATLTVRKRAADFRKQVECQVAGLTPEIDEQRVRQVRPPEGQSRAGRSRGRGPGRAPAPASRPRRRRGKNWRKRPLTSPPNWRK